MSKTAFLFPGQGVQKIGMGKDFYENSSIAREIFDTASEVLQFDMKNLCFHEKEKLDQTEYTQAALVTVCLAMARTVEAKGLKADITAGLSLGEYCALAIAGAMYDREAIYAVRKRGILMQNAVPFGEGAMSAVLGMEADQIDDILKSIEDVFIANYNCPGQIVITGKKEAVLHAGKLLSDQGARRVLPLNVSGPFHSPFLRKAGLKLEETLRDISFKTLRIPYVTNVTAKPVYEPTNISDLLIRQVASPVRWQQSIEQMIDDGVDTFVEIGPGNTLGGFMKKINRDVKVCSVNSWNTMENVLEELG